MSNVKIELYESARSKPSERYRWRTRCPENGNILARSSEGYAHEAHARAMIYRHFGDDAEIVDLTS